MFWVRTGCPFHQGDANIRFADGVNRIGLAQKRTRTEKRKGGCMVQIRGDPGMSIHASLAQKKAAEDKAHR